MMSQRLCIGNTEESFYDCVIEDEIAMKEKLKAKWLGEHGVYIFGPWKIRIVDLNLYRRIESSIMSIFKEFGVKYPSDVWFFYYKDENIEHPTLEELHNFLNLKKYEV